MKLILKNITLENIKNSNYWGLISILVWNHYSEKELQNESDIEIEENWYGKFPGGGSFSDKWNDPNYSEKEGIRTLRSIVIIFKRIDYITYIHINTNGNINCFGVYTDKDIKDNKQPNYHGSQRNLDITNWLIENNLISISKK